MEQDDNKTKGTAALSLHGVSLDLEGHRVLSDISLDIFYGELLVVLGASGSGKTSLLRLLAGLTLPSEGTLFVGEKDASLLRPAERDLAFAFQNYSLYPSKTVAGNLDFPLKVRGRSPALRKGRLASLLHFLGGVFRRRRGELPSGFSMGEKQRVAVGRALADRRGIVLLDEPLSEVDRTHKIRFIREFRKLASEEGAAVVYVTNNEAEAMALADRICVLDGGRLVALGHPLELYHEPQDLKTALSLGTPSFNTVAAVCEEGEVVFGGLRSGYPCPFDEGEAFVFGVRPEDLLLGSGECRAAVVLVERLSPERGFVHLEAPAGWVAIVDGGRFPERGETISFYIREGKGLFFSQDDGVRMKERRPEDQS